MQQEDIRKKRNQLFGTSGTTQTTPTPMSLVEQRTALKRNLSKYGDGDGDARILKTIAKLNNKIQNMERRPNNENRIV
jgi:hypothetical protein